MTKIKGLGLIAVFTVVTLLAISGRLPEFDHDPPGRALRKVILTVKMEKQHVDITYSINLKREGPYEVKDKHDWRQVLWVHTGTTITLTATQWVDKSLTCFIQVIDAIGFSDSQHTGTKGGVRCLARVS